jgi:hypothetical protein
MAIVKEKGDFRRDLVDETRAGPVLHGLVSI